MAMPAPDYAPQSALVDVVEALLALDTPPGYRAELIDLEIIVTPPPDGNHQMAISRINRQIYRYASIKVDIAANKGLISPTGRLIPDATVGPEGIFAGQDPWMPTNDVLLVVEVTSAKPQRDREDKRKSYAVAGIPLYLLVDRQQSTVVLHSEPDMDTGDYLTVHSAPYGKDVQLPAPFDFALETGDLP